MNDSPPKSLTIDPFPTQFSSKPPPQSKNSINFLISSQNLNKLPLKSAFFPRFPRKFLPSSPSRQAAFSNDSLPPKSPCFRALLPTKTRETWLEAPYADPSAKHDEFLSKTVQSSQQLTELRFSGER